MKAEITQQGKDELVNAYEELLDIIERVRKIDPVFVSCLEKTGDEILREGDLLTWLMFVDMSLTGWVEANYP